MSKRSAIKSSGKKPHRFSIVPWPISGVLMLTCFWMIPYSDALAVKTLHALHTPAYGLPLKQLSSMYQVGFILLTVVSFFLMLIRIGHVLEKQSQRQALLLGAKDRATLEKMSWRDFEFLCAEVFRQRGYHVIEGAGTQDGGIDLTMSKGGKTWLAQCKHWKGQVGVAVIREMAGVVQLNRAHGGVVVCSRGYTRNAISEAKLLGIKLINGDDLIKFTRSHR